MPSPLEVHDWHELDVVSEDGEHVGKLVDVYVAKDSGDPEFLLVSSGFLGHHLALVPAEGATRSEERVQVAATKSAISSAPTVHADNELSVDEERRLFEHYGRDYAAHAEGVVIMRRFVLVERR
jgi:sporulation protein YlmC with PRC-barrel domain